MSINAKNLGDAVLTGSLAAVYTAPSSTRAIVKQAALCNTTGSPVDVTVDVNPRSGGTARVLIDTRTLADEETYTCPELINLVVEAGGVVRASGLNVTMMLSGVEIV